MRRRTFILALLTSFSLAAVAGNQVPARAAEPAAVKLPSKEKFHLYLLIGQSNMAGRGKVQPEDQQPHPRVLMLNKQNQWAPATDPVHFDKTIAGVGLCSTFARAMAEADPSITIGLIPCAVGGTPLSRWEKEGDLHKRAMERAKIAMQDGVLRGALWHQGESDSGKEETANSYAARLAGMIATVRAELGDEKLPLVVGELGRFFLEKSDRPHVKTVNDALLAVAEKSPNTACASSEGLTDKGDKVHFSREGYHEFGRRYARLMQQLQAGK